MMKPRSEITLRPVAPDDRALLLRVYASTRQEELAPVPWTPEQKQAFLIMQFDAQDYHYRTHYPGATFDVVLEDGQPVGRLYVLRQTAEIRIMDVALLSGARGRGIGTALLSSILAEAEASGRSVTIHVEKENPALRWYRRLGFREIAERNVHWLMEWRGSVENRLVPGSFTVGSDGDEEDRNFPQHRMRHGVDALRQNARRAPAEDQREGVSVRGGVGDVGQLIHLDESQQQRVIPQANLERRSDVGLEVGTTNLIQFHPRSF